MKFIRKFDSISNSKQAILYSPTVILAKDDNSKKILFKKCTKNLKKLHVYGDNINNIFIGGTDNFTLGQSFMGEDLL